MTPRVLCTRQSVFICKAAAGGENAAWMLIGILSDTHGRGPIMAAAVDLLRRRGAEYLIHCGDVGGVDLLEHLVGGPAAFVLGNCDADEPAYRRHAQSLGVVFCGSMGDLELDGRRLAVMHGDDAPLMERILASRQHDYLLHGHTHVRHDQHVGRTRVINPGALFRAAHKSVAILDTRADALEFVEIR